MKKLFGVLSLVSFLFVGQNFAQENTNPVANETVKKECAKKCAKTCAKTSAAAEAAAVKDASVEKKVCEKSGAVCYVRKSVDGETGQVVETEVKYDMAQAKFVDLEASPVVKSDGAEKATKAKSGKKCCKGKKACKAKASTSAATTQAAPTTATEGTK